MNAFRRWAAACIMAALLAGCSQKPDSDDPIDKPPGTVTASTSGSQTSTETSTTVPPTVNASTPIRWTNCHGAGASASTLAALYDPPIPPGWEPESQDFLVINMYPFLCERVSVGPFERGPIFTLFEFHGVLDNPPSCDRDGDSTEILLSIWFNDPEVAAYMQQAHHMPAYYGEFDYSDDNQGGVHLKTWSWKIPGQAESYLTYTDPEPQAAGNRTIQYRFAWSNGVGISYMDLDHTQSTEQIQSPVIVGEIQSPMLYAKPGTTAFAGTGSVFDELREGGAISHFGDYECTKPL